MLRCWICVSFVLPFLPVLMAQESHGDTTPGIQRGAQMFLANCATCHGPDGDSVPDVNLGSGHFRHASSDEDLVKIIQGGIPGTPMPPGNYSTAQAGLLVAYLRSMNSAAPSPASSVAGDTAKGKSIVEGPSGCLECHRVRRRGGFLAPDLSEVGSTRRRSELERSLVDPNAEIRADNRTVRMTPRIGKEITARLLNQDTYSLQVLDNTGKLLTVQKASLRGFEIMTTSPMP